jgi:glycosyltransferase involved in cell wall biosynthesis
LQRCLKAGREFDSGEMSSESLVSVIIIFLNAERFIEEAIESVFAQTYDDWELILVDDGSTDASTAIARHYAEEHPGRVGYLEHPRHQNRGMSASRNLGISHAKGEYIAFLDADDVWLEYKLQQQVAILSSHLEASMVYGNTLYWHSWTEHPEDINRDFVPELGVHANALFEPPTLLTLLYPLGSATAPSLSNLLLRRRVIEHTGGFEESFKGMNEDQAFLVKAYLKETVFVSSESECWDKYRQHPAQFLSLMQSSGEYHTVRLVFLNWLAKYLYQQRVKETEIWELLGKERRIAQVRVHMQKREWKQAMRGLFVLLWYHPRAFARAYRKLRLRMKRRLRF